MWGITSFNILHTPAHTVIKNLLLLVKSVGGQESKNGDKWKKANVRKQTSKSTDSKFLGKYKQITTYTRRL